MKYVIILPLAILSLSMHAQTAGTSAATTAAAGANVSYEAVQSSAAGQTSAGGQAATRAGQGGLSSSSAAATSVNAELTKKIDTRNAKVGDAVEARTTTATKLADGTKLPSGTKLRGTVTEVRARSAADKSSHLAFALDHAILRDGREIPVHAVLTSVIGHAAATSASDDMAMSGGAMGGGAPSGGRGGVLGGAGQAATGVAGGPVNIATNVSGDLRSTVAPVTHSAEATTSLAANSASGVSVNHVPVANLPGVTLSSSTSTTTSGSLDAVGRNFSLDSGTELTLSLSANPQ